MVPNHSPRSPYINILFVSRLAKDPDANRDSANSRKCEKSEIRTRSVLVLLPDHTLRFVCRPADGVDDAATTTLRYAEVRARQ